MGRLISKASMAALLLRVELTARARAWARCALRHLADVLEAHVKLEKKSATTKGLLELPSHHGGPSVLDNAERRLAPARAGDLCAEPLGRHATSPRQFDNPVGHRWGATLVSRTARLPFFCE